MSKISWAFINDVISKRRDDSGLTIVWKLHSLFSFVLRTLRCVSVIVNRVGNLLCIHWTTLSGTVAIERTSLWVYNRSIKAEVIYDAGLFNCERLYSSSADHSLFLSIAQCYTHFLIFGIMWWSIVMWEIWWTFIIIDVVVRELKRSLNSMLTIGILVN